VDKQLRPDRRLAVRVTGAPDPVALTGTARPPLGSDPAVGLTFTRTGPGEYVSTEPLGKGRWDVRLQVMGGSAIWRSQEEVG
jgi:nitrogen fixation protein FixH